MKKPSPFLQEVVEDMLENGASENEIKDVVEVYSETGENLYEQDQEIIDDCNRREGYFWNSEANNGLGACELEVQIEDTPKEEDIDLDFLTETSEIQPKQNVEDYDTFSEQVVRHFEKLPVEMWEFPDQGGYLLENEMFLNGLDVLSRQLEEGIIEHWPVDDNGAQIPLDFDDLKIFNNYLTIRKDYNPYDDGEIGESGYSVNFEKAIFDSYFTNLSKMFVKTTRPLDDAYASGYGKNQRKGLLPPAINKSGVESDEFLKYLIQECDHVRLSRELDRLAERKGTESYNELEEEYNSINGIERKHCYTLSLNAYEDYREWVNNDKLPTDLGELGFDKVVEKRTQQLQSNFSIELSRSNWDRYAKFWILRSRITQVTTDDIKIGMGLTDPWLTDKDMRERAELDPSLYNTEEFRNAIRDEKKRYYRNMLPNVEDFEEQLTSWTGGLNETNLRKILVESFKNQFGANWEGTTHSVAGVEIAETGDWVNKDDFWIEELVVGLDAIRVHHPSGFYMDINLEGEPECYKSGVIMKSYERDICKDKTHKWLQTIINSISNFMAGPSDKSIDGGYAFSDNWDEIGFKIMHKDGRTWDEVRDAGLTKRKLNTLKFAYPDQPEILLEDMVHSDQGVPYTYEMAGGTGSDLAWYRIDQDGNKQLIETCEEQVARYIDYRNKGKEWYGDVPKCQTKNESEDSKYARALKSFLTYRYYFQTRSLNGIHVGLQGPKLENKFYYQAQENSVFMDTDVDKTISILSEWYGKLGFTFSNTKDKYGGISKAFGDCAGEQIVVTYKGDSIKFPTGLDCMVSETKYMGSEMAPTPTEIIAAIIGSARNKLTSFIDSKIDPVYLTNVELDTAIWDRMYGPEGVLNLTKKQKGELEDFLYNEEDKIRAGITTADYNDLTAVREKIYKGDKDSEYAAQINLAIKTFRDLGIPSDKITEERIIEFVTNIIKANKIDEFREINFSKWYHSSQGKQDKKFWKDADKEDIKIKLEAIGAVKAGEIEIEVENSLELIKTKEQQIKTSPEYQWVQSHLDNILNPDHQYELTNAEILTGDWYRVETGPAAGKIMPMRIAIQYAIYLKAVEEKYEVLNKQREEVDKKIFQIEDIDACLRTLQKSYSTTAWINWDHFIAGGPLTYSGLVALLNWNSMGREMYTHNTKAKQLRMSEVSQHARISWDEVRGIDDALGFAAQFFSEQAFTFAVMGPFGLTGSIAARAVGGIVGGTVIASTMMTGTYLQAYAVHEANGGTWDNFDPDGTAMMQAVGVGILNGVSAFFSMRYLGNVAQLMQKSGTIRNISRESIMSMMKKSLNLQSGYLGSKLADMFVETSTELIEGYITGEPLEANQALDVFMEVGLFNTILGFIPSMKGAVYSFLGDHKTTEQIRKNEKIKLENEQYVLNWQKESGRELVFDENGNIDWEKTNQNVTDGSKNKTKAHQAGFTIEGVEAKLEENKKLHEQNMSDLKTIFNAGNKFDKVAWFAIGDIYRQQERLRVKFENIQNDTSLSADEKKKKLTDLTIEFNELEQVRVMMVKNPQSNLSRWGALISSKKQADIDKANTIRERVIEKYKKDNNGKTPSDEEIASLASQEYHAELIREDDANVPKRTNLSKSHELKESIDDAVTYLTDLFNDAIQKVKASGDSPARVNALKRELEAAINGIRNGNHGVNFSLEPWKKGEDQKRQSITVVENASRDGRTENRTHELGHTVFIEQLGLNPESYQALSQMALEFLQKHHPQLFIQIQYGVERKKNNLTGANELVADEVVMRFLEFVGDGKVDLNSKNANGLATMMMYFSSKAISKDTNAQFGYRLDGEAGAINFLISLGKKIKEGTFTRKDVETIRKNQFIQEAKDKNAAKVYNTNVKMSVAQAAKVNKIHEEEGDTEMGIWKIMEEYEGMLNKIASVYSNVPGYFESKQDFIDEVKVSSFTNNKGEPYRSLYTLIKEYDPSTGVPLSAWINKYIKVRAIEAAERIFNFDGANIQYDENASYDIVDNSDSIIESTEGVIETGELRKILGIDIESDLAKEVISTVENIIAEDPSFDVNEKKFRQGLEKRFVDAFRIKIKELIGKDKESFSNFLIENKDAITSLIAFKYKNRFPELTKGTGAREKTAQGNQIFELVKMSDEDFVALFTEGRKGWETRRNSLIDALSAELGLDATFDAYKTVNPDGLENNLAYITTAIDRDSNVKFSHAGTIWDITAEYRGDSQRFTNDVRAIFMTMTTNQNFLERLDKENWTLLGYDFPPAAVAWTYKNFYDPNDNAISQRYMSVIKNNPNLKGNPALEGFLNQGTFRYDEDAQAEQHNANYVVVTEFLPASIWELLNGRGFGYIKRGMDAAASKLNEKGPRKDGKKMPASNLSHRGKTPLQVKNWEFDYEKGLFVGTVNGEIVTSLDPVKEHGAKLITGKHFLNYNSINDNLNEDLEFDQEIIDNVRIMNKDVNGGIMARYDAIRYGSVEEYGEYGTVERRNKQIAAIKLMLPEVIAANKANVEIVVTLNQAWFNAMLSGKVNGAQYLRFLQLQTNDTLGPKGLSTITGIQLPNEPRKEGDKTQGEHLIVNAETMAKTADLMARALEFDSDGNVIGYKKGFDADKVKAELQKIYKANTQLLLDGTISQEMDAGPGGKTSSAAEQRVNFIKSDVDLISIDGTDYNESVQDQKINDAVEELTAEQEIINIKNSKVQSAIENIIDKSNNNAEVQGASVFDFDETVGISDNYVIATRYNKETGVTEEVRISSADWPTMGEKMINEGWTMDFSDFNKVTDGKPGPLLPKLKNQIEKYGVDNVYILTARAAESAEAIKAWLASEGIDLPIENIVGLGDSTGQAKADWIEQTLIFNGFNDIYFVDDAFSNVDAVDKMFNKYPPGLIADGGKSVLVRPEHRETHVKFSDKTNNETMNIFIEQTSGVDRNKRYSAAQARLKSAAKSMFSFNNLIPYSAEDFRGLLYQFLASGDIGEYQMAWFEEKLIKPYSNGELKIQEAKVAITEAFNKLKKDLPKIQKSLKERIERPDGRDSGFTIDHAIRLYLWHKNGIVTPKNASKKLGISKRDYDLLLNTVLADQGLITFANHLGAATGLKEGYVQPGKHWTVENIASDISNAINVVGRETYLSEFIKNKNEIFSEENLNKIEAIHGIKFREALENILDRMETGKSQGKTVVKTDRVTNMYNNWVNNSVGAIMFLNGRSAVLQTLSTFNYVKMTGPNNMVNAAAAFANQPQFWADFVALWKSDYLVSRRSGQQRGINEAELMAAVEKADNKAKAAVAWLLEKGFLPTQIADSFAIAAGGAGYVRNYANSIESILSGDPATMFDDQVIFTQSDLDAALEGRNLSDLSPEEINQLAFEMAKQKWVLETESGQQSSRQDMLSQQQTGGLGRLILAFKNTPMQYTRKILRSVQDLKNGRGNPADHISKIAYYGVVQNMMFTGLQQALFAKLGEDDEEWDKSTDKVIQGMVDNILNGMGLTGAVVVTVKNGVLEFQEQDKKGWNADHTYTVLEFANFSPTIGSKLRKIYSSIKGQQINEDVIAEMDLWDPQNPAWASVANLISGLTNVPLDRAVNKINNIIAATNSENEFWQQLALVLGWNTWDVNVTTKRDEVRDIVKEEKKYINKQNKRIEKQVEVDKEVEEEVKAEEEGKGKDVNRCGATKSDGTGRCNEPVDKAGQKCQYHASKEELKNRPKCSFIKKNGKQCGNYAVTDAGVCNVPQHQPDYKKSK